MFFGAAIRKAFANGPLARADADLGTGLGTQVRASHGIGPGSTASSGRGGAECETVVAAAEAVAANQNDQETFAILLEARAKMAGRRDRGNLFGVPGNGISYPEER